MTQTSLSTISSSKEKTYQILITQFPFALIAMARLEVTNPDHPVGTAYKVKEIKARRDQLYESYTRHLVPPIHFEITQVIHDRGPSCFYSENFLMSVLT